MEHASEEAPRRAASDFARGVADVWDGHLGPRLLGAYLIGSLAHGGFGPRYSDIDVAIVVRDSLAPSDLEYLREKASEVSAELVSKLSIFWTDRSFAVGRFPPLDRIDYLDNAVPLVEREPIRPERPSADEVRTYLRATPFERWAAKAVEFAESAQLAPADHKPYLRAILYTARFIYSWSTGTIASNDDAVDFLRQQAVPGVDIDLVEDALRYRRDGRDPDDLFSRRHALLRHVEACRRLIAEAPAGHTPG